MIIKTFILVYMKVFITVLLHSNVCFITLPKHLLIKIYSLVSRNKLMNVENTIAIRYI